MKSYTSTEIAKLQSNLQLIRKAGGWSAEEFGEMIGVTKQTIRNLEKMSTVMSKTQYIAIRSVLDFEISDRPNDKVLAATVNLFLNSEGLSDQDKKKAKAFIDGASKTDLDNDILIAGLVALIGAAAAAPLTYPIAAGTSITWLSKIMKDKK